METPLDNATRLLTALEDMAGQEAALFRTLEFAAAVTLLKRMGPLVQKLASLAAEPGVDSLRPRVGALLERRAQSFRFLATQIEQSHAEIKRVKEAHIRLAQVAPAYGGSIPTVSRLHVAG